MTHPHAKQLRRVVTKAVRALPRRRGAVPCCNHLPGLTDQGVPAGGVLCVAHPDRVRCWRCAIAHAGTHVADDDLCAACRDRPIHEAVTDLQHLAVRRNGPAETIEVVVAGFGLCQPCWRFPT